MRAYHTCWVLRHITLDLRSRVICLGPNSCGMPSHTNHSFGFLLLSPLPSTLSAYFITMWQYHHILLKVVNFLSISKHSFNFLLSFLIQCHTIKASAAAILKSLLAVQVKEFLFPVLQKRSYLLSY